MLTIQLTAAHGHTYVARSFAEADALLRRLGAKPARLAGRPLKVSVLADELRAPIEAMFEPAALVAVSNGAVRKQLLQSLAQRDAKAAAVATDLLRRLATLH